MCLLVSRLIKWNVCTSIRAYMRLSVHACHLRVSVFNCLYWLELCILCNIQAFDVVCWLVFKIIFFKKNRSGTLSVSNGLDPEEAWNSIGFCRSWSGSNGLLRLSENDKIRRYLATRQRDFKRSCRSIDMWFKVFVCLVVFQFCHRLIFFSN